MRLALLAVASLLAGPAAADLEFFQMPSGNIHCMAGMDVGIPASVECEILELDGAPAAPRPADCALDWGHRFVVRETGPAGTVCAGDTIAHPDHGVFPYGHSASIGGITCASSERGLECRNREGHGFFLSRARQQLY